MYGGHVVSFTLRMGLMLGAAGWAAPSMMGSLHTERATPPGYAAMQKGPSDAAIKVDIYLDLTCPDSAAAWPAMLWASEEWSNRAEFFFHIFPLPYHRNSFTAAQAVQAVRFYAKHETNPASVVEDFIDRVFQELPDFDNSFADGSALTPIFGGLAEATSSTDVFHMLTRWAADGGTATPAEFERGMECMILSDRTRHEFEEACRRGVFSTPSVFVNEVPSLVLNVDAGSRTVWRKVLTTALRDGSLVARQDDNSESESWENDYYISDYVYSDDLAPSFLDHDEKGRGAGDEIER